MPSFSNQITGFVVFDDLDVKRTVGNIPPGQTVSEAWLTIKAVETALDNSLIQKHITASLVAGQGQITDTGGSGTAQLLFQLTGTDTGALTPGVNYVYDVQVKTSAGKHYTPEKGTIQGVSQVTLAT
jgi:hypothetical protein